MRALVFHGPWDIGPETLPDPDPTPDQVLIRVIATGICGSDIHGYTGENGRRHPGQVMGHETVGRIEALGADVATSGQLRPGGLVTVNPVIGCGDCAACHAGERQRCALRSVIGVAPEIRAAFADLMAVPAANVVPLPDDLPAELGALVEPLAVGRHALRRGGCIAADTVLVLGGGPIGQACALAARADGAAVVVSDPSPARRALVEKLGFAAIDPGEVDLTAWASDVLGDRPSLVVDAVGNDHTLADALAASALGGRVVLVGMHSPRVSLSAYALSTEERTLIGSFCYTPQHFEETAQWVSQARDDLGVLIEGRVGWDGAAKAFRSLATGENPASKVLVLPDGGRP